MTIRISMCIYCRHFRQEDKEGNKCDAFPSGIPREIFFGKRRHVLPVHGDQGVQFEPVDDCPEWILELQRRELSAKGDSPLWRRLTDHVRAAATRSPSAPPTEINRQ